MENPQIPLAYFGSYDTILNMDGNNNKPLAAKPTTKIYHEILTIYDYFNWKLFDKQLPEVIIVLQRQNNVMGYVSCKRWINKSKTEEMRHELAINPQYWLGWPIEEILSTLVHEQCHIWQEEYGDPGRRHYHNAEWADKMKSIGLMPSSTGKPGGKETGDKVGDYIILNGPMHKAIIALFDENFNFTYLDRSPKECEDYRTIFDDKGQPYHLNGAPMEIEETKPQTPDLPAETIPDDQQQVTPPKNTGRLKYTCRCGNNIWAKPNLQVMCRQCNLDFIPEERPTPS